VTVTDPSMIVDPAMAVEGRILLDGERLDPLAPYTIMLNKPVGYTCSRKDPAAVVYDLLPERFLGRKPAFSSVGRLDKYTSGQLLFTDDGDLLHRIISPKSSTSKHYHVELAKDLRGDEADIFASGTFCIGSDEKPLKPAEWTATDSRKGTIVIYEGRFHQIRKMFETLGNEVTALHRFQTGGLKLGELEEGQWIALSAEDLDTIF
jgi:16S rRNA pseudouridine516 synthase